MPLPFELNPNLATLPVYQPGRPIEDVARELGLPVSSIIKLASNENPQGPSPKALEAVRALLPQAHLYPDGNAFYLKQKLAQSLGVTPANLILGTGSNEIIEFIGHALLGPGTNIVVSQYCFAIYPIIAKMMGADVITVPAKDYGHDLDAMARAITPQTRAIFVANPNNPTGTLASHEALQKFFTSVPKHVVLVMDEAYIEFLEKPFDSLAYIRSGSHPNLILMRTFSKMYGLAGFRVGYGVAHGDFISALEKIRQPFNLNAPAQVAAQAALDDIEHVRRTRATNAAGLQQYTEAFTKLGLPYVPSAGNFILVRVGDGAGVFAAMQREGVIVRPMGGYQLPEWIRISVGTTAENERCLKALAKVLGKG